MKFNIDFHIFSFCVDGFGLFCRKNAKTLRFDLTSCSLCDKINKDSPTCQVFQFSMIVLCRCYGRSARMNTPFPPISKIEYTATVEDVSIKLSIDRFIGTKNELAALTKHTHAYSELFVCVSGQFTLEAEDMSLTLASGDAALVPPNLSHHKLLEDGDAVWCSIGFLITVNRRRSVSKLSHRLVGFFEGANAQVMRNVPEFCKEIYRLRGNAAPPNDCIPAIEFTLLLAKYAERLADSAQVSLAVPHDSDMNRVALLENLVNGAFMTDITPRTAAELLHISTRQLSRIVKKRFGTTFTRVIIGKRLETAEKLLMETERTVEAIADAVGFSSAASLHREFKAKYNMTPIEYRNSLRCERERK